MQGNTATAAPTYTGVIEHHQKKTDKVMQFFFCNDDIERCMKGTKRRWVKSRLDVPNVWPMKIGTDLSRKEILDLEHTGFQLPQRTVIQPLFISFGMEELPLDLSSYPIPMSLDNHPKTRSGKNKDAPTTKYANNYTSSLIV
jgi:hypothetical protein